MVKTKDLAGLLHRLERPTGPVDVVLDTDTYNEVDDQFALSYLLASQDQLRVKALYAAPFFNENSTGPADGMEKSYQEILKLLGLAGCQELRDVNRVTISFFVIEDSRRPPRHTARYPMAFRKNTLVSSTQSGRSLVNGNCVKSRSRCPTVAKWSISK